MNKPGILLEVVQILTDLDLIITKAYISSDGGWFMDGMYMLLLVFPCSLMAWYGSLLMLTRASMLHSPPVDINSLKRNH